MPGRRSVGLVWDVAMVGALMAATAVLLFPNPSRVWISLPGLLLWLIGFRSQAAVRSTPLNLAVFPLLIMVAVSLWTTFDIHYSLGKVAGVLLGVSWFFGVVALVRTPGRLNGAVIIYTGAALALIGAGLLGTQWKGRVEFLNLITRHFPVRFKGLPGAEEGFYPNALGGSMLWFVPVLGLLLTCIIRRRSSSRGMRRAAIIGCIFALLLTAGMLVISQSRGAWLGMGVAVLVVMITNGKLARWTAAAVLVVALAAMVIIRPWASAKTDFLVTSGGDISLAGRVEIWSRAVYGIQDFPFTGMGMNAFRKVMPVLYPAFTIPPQVDIASAHNHILQAALDLGIPGMIAYLAIWSATGRMLLQARRISRDPVKRSLAAGLAAAFLAQFTFQMTDAIPLGAKVGIFFWLALALSVSLYRLVLEEQGAPPARFRISKLDCFGLWILFSLVSIALIGNHPYVGLVVAITGGMLLGYATVENYLATEALMPVQASEPRG